MLDMKSESKQIDRIESLAKGSPTGSFKMLILCARSGRAYLWPLCLCHVINASFESLWTPVGPNRQSVFLNQ